MKPDIVFFGESLPQRFFQYMASDFSKADLLIVLGTSLTVQPFASLIGHSPLSYQLTHNRLFSHHGQPNLPDCMGDHDLTATAQYAWCDQTVMAVRHTQSWVL